MAQNFLRLIERAGRERGEQCPGRPEQRCSSEPRSGPTHTGSRLGADPPGPIPSTGSLPCWDGRSVPPRAH
jgi:hypothetical protein